MLMFAVLVDRPSVVFKFVLSHNIGVMYAQLYEDYALVLEKEKRRMPEVRRRTTAD